MSHLPFKVLLLSTNMKTILVTGGCGFIGSHFINYIHKTYPSYHVINIDKLDYCSNQDNVKQKDKQYTFYHQDLTDKDKLLLLFTVHNIDIVVHFAAQSHVDNSFGNSIQFTIDNVLGTHVLMECIRLTHERRPLSKIVHISTDEVYGEVSDDHEGCIEKSLLNPTNPYAASKAGAEFIVRSYYHSFKLPIVITRGNNVFGENQYPEKLIPKFIQLLLSNQPMTIQGEGTSKRNFIYVEDVCTAVDCIMTKGKCNEIYNIGSTDEYSVKEIASILLHHLKPNEKVEDWVQPIPDRLFNDHRYSINCEQLQTLGWKKTVSFEDGLLAVINHWKSK